MPDDNEIENPEKLRSRLGIPRHRLPSALAGRLSGLVNDRRRALALATAAVAVAGLAAAATAIGTDEPGTVTTASVGQGLPERTQADRADRSDRTPDGDPSGPSTAPSTEPSATAPAAPSTAAPAAAPSTPAAPKPKPAWVSPMPGAPVTSCYGYRWGAMHRGVDLALPPGTPVQAVGAGVVVGAGWLYGGYGISVMIDHGNGYRTHYAHLMSTSVSVGQRVSAGQVIGAEGSTGDSTGPHLHFEVHQGEWNQIEPVRWLRDRGVSVPGC